MAGNFFDPRPQYRLDDGTVCAGGTLYFYQAESEIPQEVFSDADLGVSLGASIELDSAGRTPTDVFLANAAYNVELRDSDDVQVWLAENINVQSASAASLPAASDGEADQVLSTDGVDFAWVDVRQVPDPTGASGKYLGTDGETVQWTSFPTEDALPTVEGSAGASGSLIVDGVMMQWGSDTCTGTGSLSVTKSVTFGTAFGGTPYHISVEPVLSAGVTSNAPSGFPATRYSSPSTTGFTAGFFVGEENTGGTDTINANIPFTWFAVGAAPA